jgi:hypothetical protein
MNRIKECVRKMFSSFGRTPDDHEETIQTYVEMLGNFSPRSVAEAILRLSLSARRLPSVSEIVAACREQSVTEAQTGKRNLDSHTQQVNLWYRQAVDAGWTLPQRDELVDLCDRAIDKTSGQWRANGENQMRREVAALVAKVKAFKALQEQARVTGAPEPDEMLEDWAWAIPTEGQPDWDPSLETLWEFGIRTKGMAAPEPSVDQFAWNP